MSGAQNDQLAMVRTLRAHNERLEAEVNRLKSSDGGGMLPPMDTVDAKIAASEARTDTKFAELRGDLSRFATKGTVWGAMGTALGIVLAVAAFGGDRFDAGMTVKDAVQASVADQRARDASQDRKLDEILKRLSTDERRK
ncbi:hypothetical protein [Sphingomonas adhaesiva]|uniref:hypothetical protein n=1 Tax=Sphingomonas adhaesiva TaxID=28212 RepID=UPI002FF7402C